MKYLSKAQLVSVKEKIDAMIKIIDASGVKPSACFYQYLEVISQNAMVCISNDFDGIRELSEYINDDLGYACKGKRGIQEWYLDIPEFGYVSPLEITGNSYNVTHAIGEMAYAKGYKGLIVPSARRAG